MSHSSEMQKDSYAMETLRQLIAVTPNGFLPTIVIGLVSLFSWYIRDGKPFSGFKLVGKEPGEWFNTAALKRWEDDPLKLIKEGFKAVCVPTLWGG